MSINAIGSYVNIQNYQPSPFDNETTTKKVNENNTDKVTISDNAVKANLISLSGFMDGAGDDGVITLEEMRAFRDKKMDQAQSIIRDTLNDLNIKSYGKLKIDIDGNGSVIVSGSTDENNNAIAEALQKDDQFRNTWKACSATSSSIAAAEAAIPFHDAYRADPKAAVAEYGWIIGKEWDFEMYFENGEIGYSVA
ncbi:MAG: hypothetical protein PVG39_08305 [Desulfobacteraceae bacterium]|jgi:hypothetical protein